MYSFQDMIGRYCLGRDCSCTKANSLLKACWANMHYVHCVRVSRVCVCVFN